MKYTTLLISLMGLLASCGPDTLFVFEFEEFDNERLTHYYNQLEDDIIKAREELEELSLAGRPVQASVKKDTSVSSGSDALKFGADFDGGELLWRRQTWTQLETNNSLSPWKFDFSLFTEDSR